ncbi:response regulator [Candidatus Avelusimicrobium caledoniensis]|uniref:response regulator n=1 Tax=Candidatus Avelusimicrobium caledoniensis TaxID=3416220 RepID=UPI003D0FA69E
MKRFVFLVIFCSLVAPCYAQFRPNVPKLTGAVSRQAAHAQIGYAGRLTTPGMIHTVPRVSVAGYFHLLGSGKIAEPVIHFPAPEVPKKIVPSPMRSLESLQLEATALGLDERHLATYTRQDLNDFINSYKAMETTKEVRSRFEQGEFENTIEGLHALYDWAKLQPDFVEGNYIPPRLMGIEYEAPFYPVRQLRILIVRDESSGWRELMELSKEHPGMLVDRTHDVSEAFELLNTISYDIVLADFTLGNRNGLEVSMYVWNKKLHIPVICYSCEPYSKYTLFKYNMVGQIPVAYDMDEAERVLNYLSNMVATGKAYQN